VRAHLNCLETLPVYTAIVVALLTAHVSNTIVDVLAVTLLVARVCQSLIHLFLVQTNIVAGLRFAFFFVQAICMIAMGLIIASSAPSWPIR
jgi:uncharacterized MAPEG superfamily protein